MVENWVERDSGNSHTETKGILTELYTITAVIFFKKNKTTTLKSVCLCFFMGVHLCLKSPPPSPFPSSLMHPYTNCWVCPVTLVHNELLSNTGNTILTVILQSFIFFFFICCLYTHHTDAFRHVIRCSGHVFFFILNLIHLSFFIPCTQPIHFYSFYWFSLYLWPLVISFPFFSHMRALMLSRFVWFLGFFPRTVHCIFEIFSKLSFFSH